VPRLPQLAIGVAALLCAVEMPAWLAPDAQYTFRREAEFLRSSLAPLPTDARVCMLDPAMNQEWPGPHRDFDSAWSPRGGGAYLGVGRRLIPVTDGPDAVDPPCGYYYESAACSFDPADDRFRPDVDRLLSLCATWRERLDAAPLAEQRVAAVSYGVRFAPGQVWLRLFPMQYTRGTK
jgi:hypothetical protein